MGPLSLTKGATATSTPTPLILDLAVLTVTAFLILLSGDVHVNPGPPTSQEPNELSIIHINTQSLSNKVDIVSVEAINHDIVTLSETWLLDGRNKDEDLVIDGFHPPIRHARQDGYGGVAIFIKSNLWYKPRHDLMIPGLEAVWIETKLDQHSLLICSLYRPPNSKVEYWSFIDEAIRKAQSTPYNFIILGDFNCDLKKNTSQHLLNLIHYNSLFQLVNEPTHITDTTATCIDLILTSNEDIIKEVTVLPPV